MLPTIPPTLRTHKSFIRVLFIVTNENTTGNSPPNTSTSTPILNKEGTDSAVNRLEDGPSLASKQSPPSSPQIAESTGKSVGRHSGLGGLPSIATAASAMQIDTDTSTTTTTQVGITANDGAVTAGPVGSSPETPDTAKYLADAMQAYMLQTPLSANPMSADSITPTTPGFPMSDATPTTPYSASSLHTPLTPGGGRNKHTCTHCNQTFTRHHNLKSHLLTHSHEKPFPCQQCSARFRRLHDLKRHSKLHTGERPHMCEKCGRRFARGDALARHARGEGGCAGRRSSLGGILDGDTKMFVDGTGTDGDDDGMMDEDTQMENGSDPVPSNVELGSTGSPTDTATSAPSVTTTSTSGARRPTSLPSIKTNVADTHSTNNLHPHQTPIHQIHQLQSYGTYPPMTPARSAASTGPSPGSLFPPTPSHSKTTPISATSSPNTLNKRATSPMSSTGNTNSSILGIGGMTESPRPLSPAQHSDATIRAKSPLSQFQSPGAKYAPPMTPKSALSQNAPAGFSSSGSVSHATHPRQLQPSQTPSNAPQQLGQAAPQAPMGFPKKANATPSGTGGGGAGNENPNIFENERGIWDYVKELERRVVELEKKQRGCDAFIKQAHQSLAVAAVAAAAAGDVAKGMARGTSGGGNGNTQGNAGGSLS